nr:pirin-like C-terminal cupin domain-containing protein [Rodentibacter sp. Ppn85]
MFSYNDKDKNLDPFLLMDYNPPKFFLGGRQAVVRRSSGGRQAVVRRSSGGRRDNSEFNLRGMEEHPHRTYQGEVSHRDSHGGGGTIGTGDVQWMTAGSGVMHEEMHSEKFAKEGGLFEMVQLWVNLPAKDKMTEPKYQAIKSADIPVVKLPNDAGQVRVIAGELLGTTGSASTFSPINMWDTTMNANATHTFSVPESHNVVILVLEGTIQVGGDAIARRGELVTFERGGADVLIESNNDAKLLILTGEPLNEPIVGYGPFVMNTREQIVEAFNDVQTGKFGRLN